MSGTSAYSEDVKMEREQERTIVAAILAEREIRGYGEGYVLSQYEVMRNENLEPIPAAILTTELVRLGGSDKSKRYVLECYKRQLERVNDPLVAAILAKTACLNWPADKWPGQQTYEAYGKLEGKLR